MRTKKTYIGRSRRSSERNYVKPVIIVLSILLLVGFLYLGIRIVSVKNSSEFDMKKKSVYYLYYPLDKSTSANNNDISLEGSKLRGKIFIVDGEKRVVNVINVPDHLFIFSKKLDISSSNPHDFVVLFNELVGIKADYIYEIVLKNEYLKKVGVKELDDFVQYYGKRGLKFFDYFTLSSHVSTLRPESVITEASLAKLYYSLGRFNIQTYDIPTMTSKPIKITVGDKVFIRLYVDEEKIQETLKNLK
ncbi:MULTISPECIES: hypothetical protein [Fervidobacterium]|uniref:Uncharacterized protein n=1 Tax=Fervidobacterium nodosum (strain ATCC 35602 / DSM 5306 / Rt17-B1) TaxID=381764 RepID=A7HKX8_FERNB|nr:MULTISPECIES: hypothetical protein [Fervidobacterium]ABS60561.1 hypothetical protein Fnod_0706 [Fervidobacterium nodosum Rt17-B1]KAF2962478.1 hypothetical protein AS161_00195 [Fervidobacterium sp. 2310opik-2]PHJ14138.1 hypothetical protein IM41_02440 [Fervidobacterium sp. SC_NGM5_G05]HOJ93735.1 hypothetical protein [Fervidobacterium nodosum]